MSEGFPTEVFFTNLDLTRDDGVIQCRRVSTEEMLKFGWRVTKAVRIYLEFLAEL